MNILKITKDLPDGHRWNRVISLIGALALTIAFIKSAYRDMLVWNDYVGYAVAMTIMYAPVAAVKLIAAMRGLSAPSETPPQTPESPKLAVSTAEGV